MKFSYTIHSLERVEEEIRRREETHGILIPGTNYRYLPKQPRRMGGVAHDAKLIQRELVEKVMDILGNDAWGYAFKDGGRIKKLKAAHQTAVEETGRDICYSTFYKWFIHYLKFGETKEETKRRDRAIIRRIGKPTRNLSFTLKDDETLSAIIAEKPHLYLDEIQVEMKNKCGKVWHVSTLWTRLHHLGYSLKTAVFRARQRSEAQRRRFHLNLKSFIKDPRMAIFIDETHKSANASRRGRAWSKKGTPPIIDRYFEEEFRTRYTLIGACDVNGFVTPACSLVERERSKHDRDPDRGTVDMERFEHYVEKKLVPVLGKYHLREPRSIVIMDNAAIHISIRVRDLIEGAGAKIVYTAPYSPDLNPIEFMFSVYKAGLKRFTGEYGRERAHHMVSLKEVTPKKARNYFRKAEVPNCEHVGEDDDTDHAMVAMLAVVAVMSTLNE